MYKIHILLLLSLLSGQFLLAQTLGRISLGSTHAQIQVPSMHLSYSVGEPITGTVDAGTLILTKGFQQPDPSINSFPVEWLHLSLEQQQTDALLRWATAWEENSDFFEVERSVDGRSFDPVGQVGAVGHSQTVEEYQFLDPNIVSLGVSEVYYRLRQVDVDGTFAYSKILSLRLQMQSDLSFSMYPNPAHSHVSVKYQLEEQSQALLRLTDMRGKILWQIMLYEPSGVQVLALGYLARGVYVVELLNADSRMIKRLVLQ